MSYFYYLMLLETSTYMMEVAFNLRLPIATIFISALPFNLRLPTDLSNSENKLPN